jgi:hypothetical protein
LTLAGRQFELLRLDGVAEFRQLLRERFFADRTDAELEPLVEPLEA